MDELKRRLLAQEWLPGEQIPTESALAEEYAVSRATVRAALQRLEASGLVRTRHGVGTFVSQVSTTIRAGLEELKSMSETIAEQGRRPGTEYRVCEFREATAEEAEKIQRQPGDRILYLERALLADEQVVAFNYGVIAADILPAGFRPADLNGSVFDYLEPYNLVPVQALATVHSVQSKEIGWGPGRPAGGLYLLLDQVQYLEDGRAMSWSRIFFIEDRYEFVIVRRR